MRLAKRHTFAHQVVGEFGRIHVSACGCRAGSLHPYASVTQDGCGHLERSVDAVGSIEDSFFVFLHIFVVGQRQTFQHSEQRRQMTEDAAGFATHQLHGIRILFLWH